ncbi:penicillin-binding protein 2 [Sinomicrobium sp.]
MRKLLLASIIILVALIYTGRLAYLQLISGNRDSPLNDTAIKQVYDYPERGYIYDRNGKLLVANQPSYDVMIIPREVKPLDTVEFCSMLDISKDDFVKKYQKAYTYSPRLPSVFLPQLTKTEYAALQEKMRKYEGFYIQKRSLRHYQTSHAANIFGYIREVSEYDLRHNPEYMSGELIGKQGVEEYYEDTLKGKKGVKFIQKDRFNREIGPYKDGLYDTLPVQGKDIALTIDIDLQAYGEELMVHKRGGIVALDPKTGEILALVTAPYYDPALLVGRERSKNYTKLYYDSIAKPLYDRSLLAMYPPGSPFKALNALVALQEDVVTPHTRIMCQNGYYYNGRRLMGCHCGGGSRDLKTGVALSCNGYFANIYRRIIDKYPTSAEGMDAWEKHMRSFGLGDYLGYDLPIGKAGRIPDKERYNQMYGKGRWYSTTNVSNAIGQGEILTTPIQLANITAAIANRGYYYTPHILKSVENKPIENPKFTTRKNTTIDSENFKPVIDGMAQVYTSGTGRWFQIPDVNIAGKTGTAENFVRIDGKRAQLTDHSIFVAFAPVEDPKIAIAVFVENGYWGSRYAGPIASIMIEKYLKGEVTRKDLEKRMLESSLENEYAKPLSGKSFAINE